MNLKQLNDFQIGQVKGYLACKQNKNLTEELALEQNLETRNGMKWAFNKALKEKFEDSVKEFKKALKDKNYNSIRMLAHRVCDYHTYSQADEGRLQVVTRDGTSTIEEVYSKDEIEEVQKRLEEDPNLEIVEQDTQDGTIFLKRKEDSLKLFNSVLDSLNNTEFLKFVDCQNPARRAVFLIPQDKIETFDSLINKVANDLGCTLTYQDFPNKAYNFNLDDLSCQIVCVDPSQEVTANLYYNSAPWFVDYLNSILLQQGKLLTPSGVFDGNEYHQYDSEQKFFDSLNISHLQKANRY